MKKIIVFIIILFIILSGSWISYVLYREVQEKSIQYQYEQQEMYAKQAVLSIENFFENFKHSLNFLSKKDEIINFSEKGASVLREYFYSHPDELKAITRISEDGKILYSYPFVENVEGLDVSKQSHNKLIIETKKPVISDVFLTVQGYRAIVYAYPIFEKNKYKGSISLVLKFDHIANKFLRDLKFGKNGNAFVISEDGIELFCSVKDHIGKSIHESMKDFSNYDQFTSNMLNKEEGRFIFSFYNSETSKEIVKKIGVYKPIILENTFWSIAVIIPEDEILEANKGFFLKFISLLLLVILIILLFTYFYWRQIKKTQDFIAHKEKKYKSDLEYLVKVRTEELNRLNDNLRHDIIERKNIEKELKKTLIKVEKSEKIKSDFLAQVSHEIRTPINTILSFSSLIREELSQYADEELKYGFSGIQSAGKRLIRTIDLILNMSDIQLGTHEYIPRELDIYKDIIENLIIEYKVQVNEKKIELNVNNKTDNLRFVADEYTVHQIFANLIDNAIKYTHEGRVIVECKRNNNDELSVSVIDTGVGISEDYIPKLFDEFSQEDGGYTRKFEGNGLGLALVKKYCELNKAEIKVESKKGKGSKFTVTFSQNN